MMQIPKLGLEGQGHLRGWGAMWGHFLPHVAPCLACKEVLGKHSHTGLFTWFQEPLQS